tara:strand:+ start:74 stop:367 length:294 start_codon:yes stop_codon:yes gene_type:complete
MTISMSLEIDIGYLDVVKGDTLDPVKMDFDYSYDGGEAGYISGLPEDCYPAEEASWEFYNVTVMNQFGQWSDAQPELISELEDTMYERMMEDIEGDL